MYNKEKAKCSEQFNLKPCPFCGGEARLKKHQKMNNTWYVQCRDCGIRTLNYTQAAFECWSVSRDEAIAHWNKRKE